ncbi:MAG: hypothetical protein II969_14670 [Anaerolineaceae bacterium]|nr:hypothetical protein [Anaerolineaceae bacterium]
MQTAGLPSPEYKQSEFMLYATLKNKTWGLENNTWEILTTGDQVSDQAGDQAERMRKVLEFCKIPRSKTEISRVRLFFVDLKEIGKSMTTLKARLESDVTVH